MKTEIEQSELELLKMQADYGDLCIQVESLQNQLQYLAQQKAGLLQEIRQRMRVKEQVADTAVNTND